MADSIRERIIQAVVAKLNDGTPPCQVYRCPVDAIEFKSDDLPDAPEMAIAVLVPEAETAQRVDSGVRDAAGSSIERVLSLPVACVKKANAEAGEAVDAMVDALYVWVVQQVMSDPTLGGLAFKIDEMRTEFIATADLMRDTDAFGEKTVFDITYQTAANDATALA